MGIWSQTSHPLGMIFTASWSVQLPPDMTAVGISRGVPRNHSGSRWLRELEPGPWFKSVSVQEYVRRFSDILNDLDPIAPEQYQILAVPPCRSLIILYSTVLDTCERLRMSFEYRMTRVMPLGVCADQPEYR
jgi:hypothetical protein